MKFVYDQTKFYTQNLPILGRIIHDIKSNLINNRTLYNKTHSSTNIVYYNNYSSIKANNPNVFNVELVFSVL